MQEKLTAREIHAKVEQVREGEQDFLKSLQLSDEAALAYIEEKDYYGLAELQGSRALAFSHLYQKTGDKNYLILAKEACKVGVEIAPTSMAYFRLGKALEETEEYTESVEAYKNALDKDLPQMHDRPAVRSDMKAHLGFSEYMAGEQDQGLSNMNEAIGELENNNEEVKYTRDVWLTGALMRKAKALHDKESLDRAKEIIDANPELVLRLGQWEKLASEF